MRYKNFFWGENEYLESLSEVYNWLYLLSLVEKRHGMTNLMIVGVVVIMIGSAMAYLVWEKKKGEACVGCPAAGNCPSRNGKGVCYGSRH